MKTDKKSFNKHDIYVILQNYNWMIKEANRIKLQLNGVETVGVAQYSDMPRSGGGPSDVVGGEVIRREKTHERLNKYLEKVSFIVERSPNIEEDIEVAVLNCILDGMRMNAIAIHLNMSRRTVHHIRDKIVEQLSVQKCTL